MDPLARARLRQLGSVDALVEARQRDFDDARRHGWHGTANVDALAALIADAQDALAAPTSTQEATPA